MAFAINVSKSNSGVWEVALYRTSYYLLPANLSTEDLIDLLSVPSKSPHLKWCSGSETLPWMSIRFSLATVRWSQRQNTVFDYVTVSGDAWREDDYMLAFCSLVSRHASRSCFPDLLSQCQYGRNKSKWLMAKARLQTGQLTTASINGSRQATGSRQGRLFWDPNT